MNKINLLVISMLASSLLLISCDGATETISIKECPDFIVEEGAISNEVEYEIIDAVIKNNFNDNEFVHIMNDTRTILLGGNIEEEQEYLSSHQVDVEVELIETYISNNDVASKWKDLFEEGRLMGEEEKKCFYDAKEFTCESYQNKYPNGSGFLSFTRPAVYEENVAIVEYTRRPCYGLRGIFVFLKFEDGKWQVKQSFTTIVS